MISLNIPKVDLILYSIVLALAVEQLNRAMNSTYPNNCHLIIP